MPTFSIQQLSEYFYFIVFGFLTAMEDALYDFFNRMRGIPDMTHYREQAVLTHEKSQTEGYVAIVTGGNTGIGLETCLHLLRAQYKIVIGCRNMQTAKNAVDYLKRETVKTGLPGPEILVIPLDLASLKSVKDFCARIKNYQLRVNLIINNAGVMFVPKNLTEDGFESHFGINHLGHFCLNMELLPVLLENAPSRIVILTSGTYCYGTLDPDLLRGKNYHRWWAYCNSKLCNIYYGLALDQKLKKSKLGQKVKVLIVHPGSVKTDIIRYSNPLLASLYKTKLFNALIHLRTSKDGCSGPVYAALSKNALANSGQYFHTTFPVPLKPTAHNKEKCQELWEISEKATQTSFPHYIHSN